MSAWRSRPAWKCRSSAAPLCKCCPRAPSNKGENAGARAPRVLRMNRYPVWKYAIILVALLVGAIYTLPNFFGEAPAVQVSSGKSTVKVDSGTQTRVEQALAAAGIKPEEVALDGTSIKVRFTSGDTQLKAKDAIQ